MSKEESRDAMPTEKQREALYKRLLAEAYERSQATEAASYLEIDDVIEPKDTRQKILYAIQQRGESK